MLHCLILLRGKWFKSLSFKFVPVVSGSPAMHHHKEPVSNFWMICPNKQWGTLTSLNSQSKAGPYPGWRNWSSTLSLLGKSFKSLPLRGPLCSGLSRFSLYWGDQSWVQYLGVLWRALRQGGIISSLYLEAVALLVQSWRPIVFASKPHIPLTVQQEPLSLFCTLSGPVFIPSQSPALSQEFLGHSSVCKSHVLQFSLAAGSIDNNIVDILRWCCCG